MAIKLVSTEGLSNEDWLAYRRKGIGGSDVSIICGINKYRSPIALFQDKLGQIEPSEAGESAYWGHKLESIVREEFTLRTGFEVRLEQFILQHEKYPFMFANLDGIVIHPEYGKCIFEAKTSSVYRLSDWDNCIPEEYMLQIQHYMAVTGYTYAFVAVLIGGNEFRFYCIKRDEDLIEMLIRLEADFWNHVENNIPPVLDGSDACSEYINVKYATGTATQIELPHDAVSLLKQYDSSVEEEESATTRKNEAINMLKDLLGNNEIGVLDDRIISWKNVSTERLNSKALKQALPEVYSQYINTSSSRRFTIK